MSTVKFDTWQNPDGTENYKCRAWVNFDGTGTVAIRESGNVSSITDNGTGQYTLNFTTAMPDTNYSTVLTIGNFGTAVFHIWTDGSYNPTTYSTTAVRIGSASGFDPKLLCVQIMR